jgi:hypothetical protein
MITPLYVAFTFTLFGLVLSEQSFMETVVPDRANARKFYMYSLDKRYWWAWPDQECPPNGLVRPEQQEMSGMGRPINLDKGLFATWENSLFSNIYNQLKRSSRRTYDPQEASLFIIPYDLSLDGATDRMCNYRQHCTEGSHLELTHLMFSNDRFVRHNGLDHVVLWSLAQGHVIPKVCSAFLKRTCPDCLITTTWQLEPENWLAGTNHMSYSSVPPPTRIHWHEGLTSAPWMPRATLMEGRRHRISFIQHDAQVDVMATLSMESLVDINFVPYSLPSPERQAREAEAFATSLFCIVAPRRISHHDMSLELFFMAVQSGCIPVLAVESFHRQLPFHMTETLLRAMSVVYTPCPSTCLDFNLGDDIEMMCPEKVAAVKQRIIAKVAPILQYSMPPLSLVADEDDTTPWEPPLLDAVDLALEGMMDRAASLISEELQLLQSINKEDVEIPKSALLRKIEESLTPELEELRQLESSVLMKVKDCSECYEL